jgi:hypothetical protein
MTVIAFILFIIAAALFALAGFGIVVGRGGEAGRPYSLIGLGLMVGTVAYILQYTVHGSMIH